MYAIALTRWGRPLEQELEFLSPLLGVSGYDLRMRLNAPPPLVLLRAGTPEEARNHLAQLRGRGHGAVAVDMSRVHSSATLYSPREFRFHPATLQLLDPTGNHELAYTDLLALIQASVRSQEQHTDVQKSRSFSLGRAALTGGLVMTKSKQKVTTQTRDERELVLYLFRKDGSAVLLRESRLHYEGLGAEATHSAMLNFRKLAELLHQRAPHALFDDRLATQKRAASAQQLTGNALSQVLSSSNADENDLAAHLLAVGFLQGQL